MIYRNNLITADWIDRAHSETFAARRKSMTPMDAGFTPRLGLSLYRLEPGKRAFPAHYHSANDEAILVLDGSGSLRYGTEILPLSQGDYIYLKADSGHAHQVINDSDGPLDYLCFSTMIAPEVSVYPDSNKLGIVTGAAPGAGANAQNLVAFLKHQPVDYWDGEE